MHTSREFWPIQKTKKPTNQTKEGNGGSWGGCTFKELIFFLRQCVARDCIFRRCPQSTESIENAYIMSNKSSENRDAVKAVGKTDVFYPDKTRTLKNYSRFRTKCIKTTVVFRWTISDSWKCVPSQHVLELKDHYKLVGQSWKRSYMTHLNHFQPHIMS